MTDNKEGCNDATEAYCPDLSDIRPCPERGGLACDEDVFFRCADGHFCIHQSLVCDGYGQCDDGSDEEAECHKCPPENRPGKSERRALPHWSSQLQLQKLVSVFCIL